MRNATLVLIAYAALVILTATWSQLPSWISARPGPDLVAVTAAYLGLTVRGPIAVAMAAAVVLGYLADLVTGAPVGLLACTAGLTCLLAYVVHARLLVRGWWISAGFTAFVALAAAVIVLGLRAWVGLGQAGFGQELWAALGVALATGLVGPWWFRALRRIDAAFARTARDRDAALEGINR